MKKIKKLIDCIDEELESAKDYAERYIEFKAKNISAWSSKFHTMAEDELKHADNLHALAVLEIQDLEKVFNAPESMKEEWEKSHKHYVEKAAWIKQMLAM